MSIWICIPLCFKVKQTWSYCDGGTGRGQLLFRTQVNKQDELSKECLVASSSLRGGREKCRPGASGPDLGVSSGPGAQFLKSESCIIGHSEHARFHWLGHFGIQRSIWESLLTSVPHSLTGPHAAVPDPWNKPGMLPPIWYI